MAHSYTGRVGSIVTECEDLFNDAGAAPLVPSVMWLRWLNKCKDELADHRLFGPTTATFDIDAGTSSYSLLTEFPDFVSLEELWLDQDNIKLNRISSGERFRELAETTSSQTGTPVFWHCHGETLEVWPEPDETVTNGFRVVYFYRPPDMTGEEGEEEEEGVVDPTGLPSHDIVYVYFCLWRAFMRDITRGDNASTADRYYQLYIRARTEMRNSVEGPAYLRLTRASRALRIR